MADPRFAWKSLSSNASTGAERRENSKKFAMATAKAMKSTARLFEVLKDGNIPLVGIIDCALRAGAGMLQPEITNEELANYLENSFSKIASDMKNVEEDVSKVKQIAIELRYLDGIEKVDAAYKTFIKGAENISQTLIDLRNFMFELQTIAEHSLSPQKINSYFNEIKASKDFSFESFQKSFAYVIATKAKFLLLCVAYFMHTGVADRIGEEFERFNVEFNEIFDYYQTTLAEKWIGESIRDVSSDSRNIVGIALKPGSSVERVESEFQKFNAANCFKLEIRNYTSFDLISNQDIHLSTRHVSNHTTDIKPGEWELIAGRKSSTSLKGVEGVFSWNIAGTEKFISVMFSIPNSLSSLIGSNANRLAIGIHGKSDLNVEEKLKRMYDENETNFKAKVFDKSTEPIKFSDDDNRFSVTGLMGKEQKCSIVVFLTASKTDEHSITGKKEVTLSEAMNNIEIPNQIISKDPCPINGSSSMSHRKSGLNKFQEFSNSTKSRTSPSVLSIREKFESKAEGSTSSKTDSVTRGFNPMTRSSVTKPKSNIDIQSEANNQVKDKIPTSTFYLSPKGDCNKTIEKEKFGPKCAKCDKTVQGTELETNGSKYHPECFVCKSCEVPLKESYKTKNGQPYCSDCHEKRFAEDCAKCKKKILSNYVVANGLHYHSACFVCNHCKKEFGQISYKMEKGTPYCITDWNNLFAKKCEYCKKPIKLGEESVCISSLNAYYHVTCLKCSNCKTNISNKRFKIVDGKPVCFDH